MALFCLWCYLSSWLSGVGRAQVRRAIANSILSSSPEGAGTVPAGIHTDATGKGGAQGAAISIARATGQRRLTSACVAPGRSRWCMVAVV
jgi:hypothetical protein